MNKKEHYEFQVLLKQKNEWIQKAIQQIQKKDYNSAMKCINIDAGFNISLNKILEGK